MKSWRERIAEAEGRGGFTEEDVALAHSYRTCAIGEIVDGDSLAYQRFVETQLNGRAPMEGLCLSGRFTSAVESHFVGLARKTLDAIEDRALQLKREHIG